MQEIVFAIHQNKDTAVAFVKRLRDAAVKHGRNPSHLENFFPALRIVGSTEAEAKAKLADIGALRDPGLRDENSVRAHGSDLFVLPARTAGALSCRRRASCRPCITLAGPRAAAT